MRVLLEFSNQKTIIDTKFYKDIIGVQWDKEAVRSAHLYQLFSNLKNDEYYSGNNAKGILLYPKVKRNVNLSYRIHEFDIKICTIDLTQHWNKFHDRLLEIVE